MALWLSIRIFFAHSSDIKATYYIVTHDESLVNALKVNGLVCILAHRL